MSKKTTNLDILIDSKGKYFIINDNKIYIDNKYIYLNFSNISDISFLMNFDSLYSCELSGNKITDISPLKNVVLYGDELCLTDNHIYDISIFNDFIFKDHIREIQLDHNKIRDISNVNFNNNGFPYIDLSYNFINDISFLSKVDYIDINLCNNPINDINIIRKCPNLKGYIYLSYYNVIYTEHPEHEIVKNIPIEKLDNDLIDRLYKDFNFVEGMQYIWSNHKEIVDRPFEINVKAEDHKKWYTEIRYKSLQVIFH